MKALDSPGDGRVRRALVVRGGWEGHCPVEATNLFLPVLEGAGFDVRIHDGLGIHAESSPYSLPVGNVCAWSVGNSCATLPISSTTTCTSSDPSTQSCRAWEISPSVQSSIGC